VDDAAKDGTDNARVGHVVESGKAKAKENLVETGGYATMFQSKLRAEALERERFEFGPLSEDEDDWRQPEIFATEWDLQQARWHQARVDPPQ